MHYLAGPGGFLSLQPSWPRGAPQPSQEGAAREGAQGLSPSNCCWSGPSLQPVAVSSSWGGEPGGKEALSPSGPPHSSMPWGLGTESTPVAPELPSPHSHCNSWHSKKTEQPCAECFWLQRTSQWGGGMNRAPTSRLPGPGLCSKGAPFT